MDTLMQDIRFALRTFRKNSGFTAVALLTLALGIGANTAIFSVVNAVLIRALPFEQPESLVVLWGNVQREVVERRGASLPDFHDWRAQNQSFEDLAFYSYESHTLSGRGDESERVSGETVTPGYFELLRARPLFGRTFEESERAPGSPLSVILSHDLWTRRFGGDPAVVGSAVTLSDRTFTIVGVMTPGFRGITDTAEFWVSSATAAKDVYQSRGDRGSPVLGRLKPGASLASAQADLTRIARDLERAYPATNLQRSVELTPLATELVAGIRPALLIVLGAVTVVLLIACANVASLLLARAEARQREMAIRTAIGAARSRIARQLVVEGLLLTLTAGALGMIAARWAADALIAFSPVTFPGFVSVGIDRTVLMFTFGVSTIMGLLLGLTPMWQMGGGSLAGTLKDAGRGTIGGGRLLFRQSIVTVEIALAVILLVGAGLLIRTMSALSAIDPGFHVDRVLTLRVSLPALPTIPGEADADTNTLASSAASPASSSTAAPSAAASSTAALTILERVRNLPGVEHAAVGTSFPFGDVVNAASYTVEGQPPVAAHERPRTYRQRVVPGFFETLGIKLVAGRDFTEAEMHEEGRQRDGVAPAVLTPIIVSERLVDRFWPGQNPIGKRMKYGAPDSTAPWMQIVGVVGETTMRRLPVNQTADPDVFQPFRPQVRTFGVTLRTAVPPETLIETVRRAIRDVEPGATVFNVATMEERVTRQMARPRFVSWLMSVFAGLALLLSAIGVYGVLAQNVARRTQEIGIRMALGAGAAEILRLVLRRGLGLVGVGLAIGAAGALAMTRLLQTMLFGVSQTDPVTFGGVIAVLGTVALVATLIPARRAMRVDPLVALRRD
jgi:ABC-type antimicrobial peptide transport system permease subunit